MSQEHREGGKVDWQDLSIDGRPVAQRPPELRAMTLDEADSGLYRREISTPRSTYDPFMAHFGEVSLAEGLRTKHAGRRQRVWAWVMLVIPSAFLGCLGTLQAWDDVADGQGGALKAVLRALVWWLPTAFWLYVIYRRPATNGEAKATPPPKR